MEMELKPVEKNRSYEIRCVLPWQATVGESPIWNEIEQRLYWIDIQGHHIHRFDPVTGVNESFQMPDVVTCISFRKKGGLILTLKKNFAFYDPKTRKLQLLQGVEPDQATNRFNDGKCDPQGRFWAGTMNSTDWNSPNGHLYRLDKNHQLAQMQSDVVCSNGTGWSPDSKTMYHTETFRYAIFAYDFSAETGEITNRRTFATFEKSKGGFPDGLTVDADGFIWSNLVGIGQIHRFDPNGKLERILHFPVPRTTDCTFGGPSLQTLYVTSAQEKMTPEEIAKAPLSGSLFAVDFPHESFSGSGRPICGSPTHFFAG